MLRMSEKAQRICDEHSPQGLCSRDTCPLAEPCKMLVGDTANIWADRISLAANELAE